MVDITPDGPRLIQARHQLTLPTDQLDAIGVGPGDKLWVALNPDRPGTLVVLTEETMAALFEKGWSSM